MNFNILSQRTRVAIVLAAVAIVLALMGWAMTGAGIVPQIDFYLNDSLVGTREGFNAIEGGGISINAVDSAGKVDYTFTVTAATNAFEEIDTPEGTSPVAMGADTLTLLGSGLQILGDASNDTITFTVTAAGAANSFSIFNAPEGTDPVADAPNQTLNFVGSGLLIEGDSGTDTLTFTVTGTSLNVEENGSGTVTGAEILNFLDPLDVSADGTRAVVSFDTTEVNSTTWGDGSAASISWAFDIFNVTNPILTFTADTVTISNVDTFEVLADLDANLTDDNVWVGNSSNRSVESVLQNCDGSNQAVTYTTSSNTFGCNTITAGSVTEMKNITVLSPSTTLTNFVHFKFATAATINRVSCSTDVGTTTIQLDERAEGTPNTAGTDILSSTLVCDTDTEATTTFSNAGIAADAPVNLQITATASSPAAVRIHVEYTLD